MQNRLARAIAVPFKRQHNQPRVLAKAFERAEHTLALHGERARIRVILTMDHQHGLVDLLGMKERRHGGINLLAFPEIAFLTLETERGQRAIISTGASNTGSENIAMGQQIRNHERTIGMARNRDLIGICNAPLHQHIHGGLGAAHELLAERVVRQRITVADNRHLRIIEYRYAVGQMRQRPPEANRVECIRAFAHLTGHFPIAELQRIGPQQHRKRTITGLIPRRQIERASQFNTVIARVANQFFINALKCRIRMREFSNRFKRARDTIAKIEIRLLIAAFTQSNEAIGRLIKHCANSLVVRRFRLPEALSLAAFEIVAVQKRNISLRRGADTGEIHEPIVCDVNNVHTELVGMSHRRTGIAIRIVKATLVKQTQFAIRIIRIGNKDSELTIRKAPVDQHHAFTIGKADTAIATLHLAEQTWFALKWCGPGEHMVVEGHVIFHIAAVLSLGPDQLGGYIIAPLHAPWAGTHRIETLRNVLCKALLGHALHQRAVVVDHIEMTTKAVQGNAIGIRALNAPKQPVAPIRRRHEAIDHRRFGQLHFRSIQRDATQLARAIEIKQSLVMRRAQQILESACGRAFPGRDLNHRHNNLVFRRRRASCIHSGVDDQTATVTAPAERCASDHAIQWCCAEFARRLFGHIQHPKPEMILRFNHKSHMCTIRRPERRLNTPFRQTFNNEICRPIHGLQTHAGKTRTRRGTTKVTGIQLNAGQLEFGLGQISDRHHHLALQQRHPLIVRR